ncbi:MAG: fasciclin domain-containing protein [Marinifilaceae bacterium]
MKNIFKLSILFCLLWSLFACEDTWDKHFKQEGAQGMEISTENLMEYLRSQPQYSRFVQLLDETGVGEELTKNQVLTVWAVSNDQLPELPTDAQIRKSIALHHINNMALYYPKLQDGKQVKTLAGKNAYLLATEQGFELDGNLLVKPNQLCANGVIHEINGMLDYKSNLYDVLTECSEEYSLFRDHFLSYSDTLFREDLSFPIGVTPTGQTIYDSVFVIQNPYLNTADLRDENKKFTLFLPNNEQYDDAMTRISSFYGNMLTKRDSLVFKNWILSAAIHNDEITTYEDNVQLTSAFSRDWRTQYQKVDPNYTTLSNGIHYNMTYLHIPRNLFEQTYNVIHNTMYKKLNAEQKEKYYTGEGLRKFATDFNSCLHSDYDKNAPEWSTTYTMLREDRDNGYMPILLPPGKYNIEMSFRAWYLGKHDVYVNGKLVKADYNFGASPYETSNYKLRNVGEFEIKESDGMSEVVVTIKLKTVGDAATGPRLIIYETKVSPQGAAIY